MNYSEKTLRYYNNVKNIADLDESLPNVGTGIVGSPLCGDVMKLQISFDENDVVTDAKFKVFGCVSAIASMEYVTTLLKGLTLEQARMIKNSEVADNLELSEIKRHCSVLAQEAIEAAISNYLAKKNHISDLITVSEKALEKLKELVNEHNALGVSITIISESCSGIDYSMAYVTEEQQTENLLKIDIGGLSFFYAPEIDILIRGLNIDLIENTLGHGFIMRNQNHVGCQSCDGSCGR